MTVLQIFRGDDFLEEVVLSRAVMGLGRHPQNDIVLDDRSLSRFHARVERRGDRFVVVDCGAQNGVHLNGQRVVGESDLAPGDRITLGRYIAIFDSTSSPAHPGKKSTLLAKNRTTSAGLVDSNPPALDSLEGDVEAVSREEPDDTKQGKRKDDVAVVTGPSLVLLFNGMEVSRHPIKARGLIIGRSKSSDVVISLLGLSRKHARVVRSRDTVTVEDLGSQNGTWVNNQRIAKARKLRHGDLLNFYDYAVLFLEDGRIEVSLPAVLPSGDTGPLDVPMPSRSSPLGAEHSPVPLADSDSAKAARAAELADLGDGSFLGDDFEDDVPKRDDDPLDDFDMQPPSSKERRPFSDVADPLDLGNMLHSDLGNDDVKALLDLDAASPEAGAFDGLASGTEGEARRYDKTTATPGNAEHAWPSERDLLRALSNAPDTFMVHLEVILGGKPYTQMPLSQTITRVGTDARCELSLPKSSGLKPWHLTLMHLGDSVVLYRAGRAGKIQLGNHDVDMAILRDDDLLDLGTVKLKLTVK